MWKKMFNRNEEYEEVVIPPGNAKRGKNIYNQQCAGCHSLFGDAATLQAPPLYDIMNKKAGATAYSYSRALRRSNLIWTDRNMFLFLGRPSQFLPGNIMRYPGLKSIQKRADLIAYLHSCDQT